MEHATKTQFGFEPGAAPVAIDGAAVAYTTPEPFRETLEDLTLLRFVRATWRYRVRLDAGSGAGAATLRLTDGTSTLASVNLDLSAQTEFSGALPVDVSGVNGAAGLRVELEVTSAADAGRTAELAAQLNVAVPLSVLNC